MPFLFKAAVLATFVYPNHIVCLCSWGFTHLPPTYNFKSFGYSKVGIKCINTLLPLNFTLDIYGF
ncbi:hypothetical protein DMC15_14085 [Vibrio sp. 11986-1-5]|nr:hypothetical protein DMC15_14085 [Vibrio sp. 11986-1-5]